MLYIQCILNELMSSNSYVIYSDNYGRCIIVDPGSEKCIDIIRFLDEKKLSPEYIFLTHEHTDHTWGCNTLKEKYAAKIICSQECQASLFSASKAYFQLYYDNPNYEYKVTDVDILLEDIDYQLNWNNYNVLFVKTPGHSAGSVCLVIDNKIFTGDAIMQYKPVIDKKNGGSLILFEKSVNTIIDLLKPNTEVFPGHGDSFVLEKLKMYIYGK